MTRPVFRWSDWQSLVNACRTLTTVDEASGVYQIRWVKRGQTQGINRCRRKDRAGIVYIGQADNLRGRIGGHSSILDFPRRRVKGTFDPYLLRIWIPTQVPTE